MLVLLTSLGTELWLSPRLLPEEEWFFEGAFNLLKEVPLTREIARFAGERLRGFPVNQARRLFVDAIIGTSALSAQVPVYTRNPTDIGRFAAATRRY